MEKEILFSEDYHYSYGSVTHYTCLKIIEIFRSKRMLSSHRGSFSLEEAIETFSCHSEFIPSLKWALDFLVQEKILDCIGEIYTDRSIPLEHVQPVKQIVETETSKKLIQFVANHWMDVISGQLSPVKLFFGKEGGELWNSYFSNDNGLYRVHNAWLAQYMSDLMTPKNRVLELGAGFGSATEQVISILEQLNIHDYTYYASDLSNVMLRKIKSNLKGKNIQTVILDFDEMLSIGEGFNQKFDFVVAVNALHCAKDVEESLTKIKKLLAPNGCLILSECTRGIKKRLLHQEFIFNLLPGYRKQTGETFEIKGFMSVEEWRESFSKAGFKELEIISNEGGQMLASIIRGRVA